VREVEEMNMEGARRYPSIEVHRREDHDTIGIDF